MLGKIFKILLNSILILFLGFGVLVLFSTIPFAGNYKIFTVQSGSMEPKIKTGSLIFTKSNDSYRVGDVITRRTLDANSTITHRIIEEKKQEKTGQSVFVTKGDANDSEDSEIVSPESIVGKVIFTVPYLGYPVGYARTQQGFILLIIIPAVIIIYEEILKIKNEIKRKIRAKKSAKKDDDYKLNYVFHKKEAVDDVLKANKE